jgi:hypothetical protein
VLAELVAGTRGGAVERAVVVVSAAYYGGAGRGGQRAALRPVIEVIERGAPGVVLLVGTDGGAGFEIRPAERPFPPEHEGALRAAAAEALAQLSGGAVAVPAQGLWNRFWSAVRRVVGG